MTMKTLLITACLLGMTGVVCGAFGAHALRDKLSAGQLDSFEVGVRYQLIHAVVLLVVALLFAQGHPGLLRISGTLFAVGIVLFSGSIYLLATRELIGLTSWKWLGPVTPLGGLCLISGWATLLVWAVRLKTY